MATATAVARRGLKAEIAKVRKALTDSCKTDHLLKATVADPQPDEPLVVVELSWCRGLNPKFCDDCTIGEFYAGELRMLAGILAEAARAMSGESGIALYDMTPDHFEVGCDESEDVTFKVQGVSDSNEAKRKVREVLAALSINGVDAESFT